MAKSIPQIIQDAIDKQEALLKNGWKDVLISDGNDGVVPPIVWFGNMNSKKPKIVTIGVNPSNKEFCDDKGNLLREKRIKFSNKINELTESYNTYFEKKPYTRWFGKMNGNWAVEGLINALDASFYNNDIYKHQAIHIDLFPFATSQKFKSKSDICVSDLAENDLFVTDWTYDSVSNLIKNIQPKRIIIFGRTNIECFEKYVREASTRCGSISISDEKEIKYRIGEVNIENMQIPIVFIYSYISNERGFKKGDLDTLREYIKKEL